mgnify:FL=1
MISNLQLPNSEEFDVDTTLTLTRRQTKETLALLSAYPERYRWIQPHTTFDYIAPKAPNMYDLHFRVVRFRISDGCYETIYTDLDPETFPVGKIKELYRLRWGIETSFRELKYTIGLPSMIPNSLRREGRRMSRRNCSTRLFASLLNWSCFVLLRGAHGS